MSEEASTIRGNVAGLRNRRPFGAFDGVVGGDMDILRVGRQIQCGRNIGELGVFRRGGDMDISEPLRLFKGFGSHSPVFT